MTERRRIAVLTTGRQDFGILRSTCHAIAAAPNLELLLLVGGMHLQERYGLTVGLIEREGLPIAARIPPARSTAADEASRMLAAVTGILESLRPDALLMVGDRTETLAAALGAQIARVPIVHLHGGEETEGAIDNALRHALTKLSHLHLVSHVEHARRVRQMGEPDATVHVVGAPGLDNLHRADLPDRARLAELLGIGLRPPVVMVTHHPATLGAPPVVEMRAVLEALGRVDATYVITRPNNDPGADEMLPLLETFVAERPKRATLQPALGESGYFALMKNADAMVGNSSSGLIEAPIVRLPVVNVGDRQKGRLRGDNVIDTTSTADAILLALRRALDPQFRASLEPRSPYGDGRSAPRIVDLLSSWQPPQPPRKRFVDRDFA